jgi:hypothetical protein
VIPQQKLNLSPVARCPVCGSASRSVLHEGVMNIKPDSYTERFADYLGTSHAELLHGAAQMQCSDCGTIYLDPWLSRDAQVLLFQMASPTHIGGWTEWEYVTRTGRGRPYMENLVAYLGSTLGNINHYVEIACPFSGLLLTTAPREQLLAWRATKAPSAQHDWRMTKMARLHGIWERLGLRLVDAILRLRQFAARSMRSGRPNHQTLAGQRTFAMVSSLRRWNLGCNRFGAGCAQVAVQALDCDVKMLNEMPPDSADLIGIFNSLDHLENPVEVLKQCLAVSPRIIVGGHEPRRAKYQHAYALDDETIRRLGTKHGFSVTNISGQIADWPGSEYLVLLTRG